VKGALELWLAQGFGMGRIPFAPGTFGSVVGLLWFALLAASGKLWVYATGAILGVAISVILSGIAEKVLREKDPGSVVIDEIIAIPFCFAGWVGLLYFKQGFLPSPEYFCSRTNWAWTLGIFVLFRSFDVAKPWPVRQSQALPGGWGVTVDDLLAAVYVNLVVGLIYGGKALLLQ
jgi:phosphatidylglycerophosphatase A